MSGALDGASVPDAPQWVSHETLDRLRRVDNATVLYLLMMRAVGRKYGHGPTWMEGVASLAPGRRLVGRAVTLRYLPSRPDLQARIATSGQAGGMNETPRWQAIETCGPGDVLVADAMGQGDVSTGGEIVYARLKERGAAGLVTDGAVRDAAQVIDFGMPLFAGGRTPTVGETRIMPFAVNVPIQCGKVLVWPGDVVMGDDEGVIVLPAAMADEVVEEAERHDDIERAILDHMRRHDESPKRFYPFNDDTMELYRKWKEAKGGGSR